MHKLGTDEIDKISLSCFDDKRYMLDDEIHTLAYFNKDSVTKRLKKIVIKKKGLKKIVIKKRLKKIVIQKIVKRLKKIVIRKEKIEKDCDKKHCEKASCQQYDEFSSNVDEAIKTILNFFIFFNEKILHAQKAQKA